MKTIYAVCEQGRVLLKEKELSAPGPGQVLLQAIYSAMSPGTEKSLMAGDIVPLPANVGYAMVAKVIETGPETGELNVGDYVVTTGEHAQYLIMDEMNCTPCPEDVDLRQAAFWNLAHTGLYALRQSKLQMGEPCAVLGQGFVGAITAQCARIAGAVPVIVSDLDEVRLEAARKMGVDLAINVKDDPMGLRKAVESLDRAGLPVVFEATGARKPLMEAAEVLAERGRLVMISQVHGEGLPQVDGPLMQKGASLIGTYVNSKPYKLKRADLYIEGTWPPVMGKKLNRYHNSDIWTSDEDIRVFLNLLKYKKLDITPLISHEFDYTEIPEAYDKYVWDMDPTLTGGVIRWS